MNYQGRNGQVYNTIENNNENEVIRYISYGIAPTMQSSLTSSLVNTRNVNQIFNIPNCPFGMNDNVSLFEAYGMGRIDVPYMLAAQPHMRSFTSLTNDSANINLNLCLGRNEQVYNTSENNDQYGAIQYISEGVENTMQSSLTSSLVNTGSVNEIFNIPNYYPLGMNDNSSLFEAYGMRRIDVPYMPAQIHMRSFPGLTNNSANINLNLFLGRNGQVYHISENNGQNEAIQYISDGVSQTMHSSLTSSLMNTRMNGDVFLCEAYGMRRIDVPYMHAAQTQGVEQRIMHSSLTSSLVNIPNCPFGMNDNVSLSEAYGMRRIDVPYMSITQTHMRSFPILTNNSANIDLNLSLGLSSSGEESHRRRTSSTITNEIHNRSESVGFVGNQPHIRLRHDPELLRAVISEMMLRIEQRRQHIINERGLTEDEIMRHISCGNFEVAVEGTSENKELCCICQETFVIGEEIGKLDCAHIFHMNCIKAWLSEKNICPLCKRRGLSVDDDVIHLC